MSRLIPNDNTHVRFCTTIASATLVPTEAEVEAGVNLTGYLISLNASSTGNVVPTPAFDTLFETSISGTNQATFTADFYRDDVTDTAWSSLPRGTDGYFVVSRFGGSGTANLPQATDVVEVWPVTVTSRTMQNMANNTVMTFTVTCSVPQEPNENATVGAGAPDAPTFGAITPAPTSMSVAFTPGDDNGSAITGYTLYTFSATGATGASPVTGAASPIVSTGLPNLTTFKFKLKATNAIGDTTSGFSATGATTS